MKTIADPRVLHSLVSRLRTVRPESTRRWGTLTPHEMLCHLGDATALVLGTRRPPGAPPAIQSRPIRKLVRLWFPTPWPRGQKTLPLLDPRLDGTAPAEFVRDRDRAIAGLEDLAAASHDRLPPGHRFFGPMSRHDWHRWAYKHTDHHLRQFGL